MQWNKEHHPSLIVLQNIKHASPHQQAVVISMHKGEKLFPFVIHLDLESQTFVTVTMSKTSWGGM